MSEDLIVKHCAPTLAGLKTGSIFNCPYSSREHLCRDIHKMNLCLAKKGIRFIPLRLSEKSAMIYIYRPDRLRKDLLQKEAESILESCGYENCEMGKCLSLLRKRLKETGEFPHEIGLFLGYPPEDVKGFIVNRAGGYKLCGNWKVYGDVKKAGKTFALYRKCTKVYARCRERGTSIERLTVAG